MAILVTLASQIGLLHTTDALEMMVTEPAATHFRKVGSLAGTTVMGHLILNVNVHHQSEIIDTLCSIPNQFIDGLNVDKMQDRYTARKYLLIDIRDYCLIMADEVKDRQNMWFSPWNGNRGKRSCRGHRVRRQLGELFGLGGMVMAASALYQQEELKDMINLQEDKLNGVIEVLNEDQTRLSINERSISILNETVHSLGVAATIMSEDLHFEQIFDRFQVTMAHHFEETRRVLRGWDSVLNHQINPDILRFDETNAALTKLKNQMAAEGYEMGINNFVDLFRLDVSHILFPNGTMLVMIHIPGVKFDSNLKLYEYINLPFHLGGAVINDEGTQVVDDVTMIAKPEHKFLGLSDDGSSFRAYTQSEIDRCRVIEDVYFCDLSIYDKRRELSCLVSLYNEQVERVKRNCVWSFKEPSDYAIQLDENNFLIYHATEEEARLSCDDDLAVRSIAGLVQVYVPPHCRLWTPAFVIDGQANYTVAINSYVPRDINVTALMEEMNLKGNNTEALQQLRKLALVGSAEGIKLGDVQSRIEARVQSSMWRRAVEITLMTVVGFICLAGCVYIARVYFCNTTASGFCTRCKKTPQETPNHDLRTEGAEIELQDLLRLVREIPSPELSRILLANRNIDSGRASGESRETAVKKRVVGVVGKPPQPPPLPSERTSLLPHQQVVADEEGHYVQFPRGNDEAFNTN